MTAGPDSNSSRAFRRAVAGRIAPIYAAEPACVAVIACGPRAYLETLAARGDFLLLRTLLARIERQLVGILLALNRVFAPSAIGNWTPATVAQLTCLPPDFLERARRLWFLPDDAAIAEAHTLMADVFALVDGSCPGIDSGPARARIAARSADG